MKRFLVTTAIESTWIKNQPVLFLGEWCRKYSNKSTWEILDAEVLPYHWDDRDKLHSDYIYLKDFYERLLIELSEKLNYIHGTEHDIRYWRILIGPWLGYFTQIIFDRWTSIMNASNKYELSGAYIESLEHGPSVPDNMKHFMKLIATDFWNQSIYSYILENYTSINCISLPIKHEVQDSPFVLNISFSKKIKEKMLNFLNIFTSIFVRKKDALFINTYLSRKHELRLCLSMFQIPRFFFNSPEIKIEVDKNKRKWRLLESNFSDFEVFARDIIPKQIPTLYIEGFKSLINASSSMPWPCDPRFIFTSSSYSTNDIFKAYAAEKTENGSPLVIGQHGGGIGTHLWSFYEEHQIEISDSYLSWGWSEVSNPKVKPVGQFKLKSPLRVNHAKQNGILLVTVKLPIHSYHLFSSPISSQWLNYFDDQCEFVETLNTQIRDELTVRLKSDDLGWEPNERWKNRFPDIVIDQGHLNISSLIKRSRIYVATYNATTFLESFTMNVPTVKYWNPNHWELRDSAIPYFDELKKVGILHDTPASAAMHINNIWDEVDLWWSDDALQEVLTLFKKRYSHIPENNILIDLKKALNKVVSDDSKYRL